jgi:hypothetical protein
MASTMRFVLPLQRDDLLRRPQDDQQFWLSSGLLSPRELITRLKQTELALRQSGSASFVDNGGFEVLFSALAAKESGGHEAKAAALDILQRGLEVLEKELDTILSHGK